MTRWEHFAHDADIGVRGFGSTLAESFEQAALALTALITDPAGVKSRNRVAVECSAPDTELLFAEWLNSVIYQMATRHMVFSRFAVSIESTQLAADLWGERIDARRHRPAVEIKGATYTALKVAHEGSQWVAQTVVDV